MKLNQDRKRSQSCADYKTVKGKTMDSDRKPARSQERSEDAEAAADIARLQMQRPSKPVPQTTTNQAGAKSLKQRSFVDEITKLTQQVEKELGLNRTHHAGRTQGNHLTAHTKLVLKQQPKSVLNDTGDSGMPLNRTQLASLLQDNKESTKRTRRRERMSLKVQKFIERKKREEMIKRSLEQTIEAEKHHKIQQNLKNLDKFVQQHLR